MHMIVRTRLREFRMRRQQIPTALHAVLPQSRQYGCSTVPIEALGRLQHSLALRCGASGVGFPQAASRQLVAPVHGARFIAV